MELQWGQAILLNLLIFLCINFSKFYETYPQYKPVLHTRLADDIFILWEKSLTELNAFLDTLNSFHSTIKFEITYSTKEINFLDTTVYIDHSSNTLHTTLYIKPTQKINIFISKVITHHTLKNLFRIRKHYATEELSIRMIYCIRNYLILNKNSLTEVTL